MSRRQLEEIMWADACAAMDRAERLHRQFFHHGQSRWEAPIDVFETDDALTISSRCRGSNSTASASR